MKLAVDAHVHSINSIHAYSTISECTIEAAKKNIQCIAITDHFGPEFLTGTLLQSYAGITNMRNLPEFINGVRVINGVEIDIIDQHGRLAFDDAYFPFDKQDTVLTKIIEKSSVVIASYHDIYAISSDFDTNTKMFTAILNNPHVNILGHCDRVSGGFDIDYVLSTAAKENKIIELNCQSLLLGKSAVKKIKEIATKCAERNVYVAINSDAHYACNIGEFTNMIELLTGISFPEKLVVTTDERRFLQVLDLQKKCCKTMKKRQRRYE